MLRLPLFCLGLLILLLQSQKIMLRLLISMLLGRLHPPLFLRTLPPPLLLLLLMSLLHRFFLLLLLLSHLPQALQFTLPVAFPLQAQLLPPLQQALPPELRPVLVLGRGGHGGEVGAGGGGGEVGGEGGGAGGEEGLVQGAVAVHRGTPGAPAVIPHLLGAAHTAVSFCCTKVRCSINQSVSVVSCSPCYCERVNNQEPVDKTLVHPVYMSGPSCFEEEKRDFHACKQRVHLLFGSDEMCDQSFARQHFK